MGDKSGIEWTDATWNPVTGCDRVSPGCAHCYALDLAARLKGMGQKRYQRDGDPKTSGPGFGVTLHPDRLEEPIRWTKPRMIFVNSMSDLFHEEIPDEYIAQVFAVMYVAGQHIFQVLTKRPDRMFALLNDPEWRFEVLMERHRLGEGKQPLYARPWPIPNVWLGVSIENRRFVDRADLLRQTPAAVRFISAEPLLGPLLYSQASDPDGPFDLFEDGHEGPELDLDGIDWLIVGGESGPEHRPMKEQWVRALRDRCIHGYIFGSTSFFFKQWGGRTPKSGGRELDGRTWSELPKSHAVTFGHGVTQ